MTDSLRAVKVSRQERGGRSLHELNMLKCVHCRSLPRIIDVFQENGMFCLVMEYVNGKALSEYVGQGDVSEAFFFDVAIQLLETLEYLHTGRVPILHLDVKPSNILIRNDGRLTLLDLGAAMPVGEKPGPGMGRFGTPGYAAPEQFGQSTRPDERTDLYSFGATMFFLLTGEKYEGQGNQRGSGRLTKRHVQKDGGRGQENVWRRPGWRGRMFRLLFSCLEQKQELRPESAAAVRKRLLRIKKQWEFVRSLRQAGFALLLLTGVLGLTWREIGGSAASESRREQKYEKLISRADLAGISQAVLLYRQAVLLCPQKAEPYQRLIEKISEDCVFSLEEEAALQSLMDLPDPLGGQRVFENVEEGSDDFGELAYNFGIAYWYFYEGAGGRTAAAGWFAKAVQSAEKKEEGKRWLLEAGIYQRIGSYYGKLGKQDITGEAADPAVYWKDLTQLYQIENSQGKGVEAVKRSLTEERLNLLIFEAAGLQKAGIQKKELTEAIEEMEQKGALELFPDRCGEARKAVERAFKEEKHEQER